MSKNGLRPFAHAWNGITATYRTERNFKIHLTFSLAAIALGIGMHLSASDWCWITLCIALVFVAELINTAIESVVNLVSPAYHPLAKKAKDAAAGAVLIAAVFSLVVGGIIFLPKLWRHFVI
ncbi:diacylglycerol kinase (ATP) [Parapedobacter luteus]|uniref:Diacylglycerol kinase (ATP) n=1 Tax=Parapedobacter luteus TaxID=623280 RepID=A0A1T5CWK5_9SPHI|nr:diacylglycerol kinase family protein [Parapedobacter luteus]SKB63809.1 diacylglycerol kinase (ATP) [Parapedobacter luteus]